MRRLAIVGIAIAFVGMGVSALPATAMSEDSSVSVIVNNSSASGQVEPEALSIDESRLVSEGVIRVTMRYKSASNIRIADGVAVSTHAVTNILGWQAVTFDIYLPVGAARSVVDVSASNSVTLAEATVQLVVTPPAASLPLASSGSRYTAKRGHTHVLFRLKSRR